MDKLLVSSQWIFKTNNSTDGSVEKFKETFVTRGFSQKEGNDYEDAFSPLE